MPSSYAHYRFGTELINRLPSGPRRAAERFRRLYDTGQQGPDLLYFYNPFREGKAKKLADRYHRTAGADFFAAVREHLPEKLNEGQTAYLFGLLGHYCLYSVCHPFIDEVTEPGRPHAAIETEFDRFLMEADGKRPPYDYSAADTLVLTRGECETAAEFYPEAGGFTVRRGIRHMHFFINLLAAPEGFRRKTFEKVFPKIPKLDGFLMPLGPDPRCRELDAPLTEKYELALDRSEEMARQLLAFMEGSAPLGEEFAGIFG